MTKKEKKMEAVKVTKEPKKPGLMGKLIAKQQAKRVEARERLGGEDTLYMGDPALHWGVGGWIRGRANLIYGPSKSGKSTLALKAAGTEQKKSGGWVVIFDSEYALNDPHETDEDSGEYTDSTKETRSRLTAAGIDPDKVLLLQSNEVNVLFEDLGSIEEQVKDGSIHISAIVVDSWGGIQGETARNKINDGEVSGAGNSYGGNAKVMGPILQTLLRLAAENGVTEFFVQHCIQNMDQYGPRWLLIGGEKLKYLVHSIVFLEGVQAKDGGLLANGEVSKDNDGVRVGKKIRFRCEKSRKLVEGRKGEFWLNFNTVEFALPELSLFNLSTGLGVIAHPVVPELETSGPNKGKQKTDKTTGEPVYKTQDTYWEFPVGAPTPLKFHGQKSVIEELKANKNFFNEVYQACMKSDKKGAITEVIGSENED